MRGCRHEISLKVAAGTIEVLGTEEGHDVSAPSITGGATEAVFVPSGLSSAPGGLVDAVLRYEPAKLSPKVDGWIHELDEAAASEGAAAVAGIRAATR